MIKLDQKVVAIVGPNEAGKTTLLRALAFVDTAEALPLAQRSRASAISDATPIASLRYRLSDEDRDRLASLELHELPTDFYVSRRADGDGPHFIVKPVPRKSEALLSQVVADLSSALGAVTDLQASPIEVTEDDSNASDQVDGGKVLNEVRLFHSDLETYLAASLDERDPVELLRERAEEGRGVLEQFVGTERMVELMKEVVTWIDRPDPTQETKDQLWNLTPDVVMFEEADRSLSSTYVLDENLLGGVPPALGNLARLAELDLKHLVEAVQSSQISRRDTLKNKANRRLAEYFGEAWGQSDLKVELNIEDNVLRIGIVEDGVHASVFDERSAGLRMFVALTSFLASRNTQRATILLIDEAENHLHIDAQADLVQMFARQHKADKIIYTTHSPACLPADLGVGIRAVVPNTEETSNVENSFWRQRGGAFTSLMFAMGASAAAFTPARCAVIAEGPTDMILLPTLVRAATEILRLPYQVAPGLSEMPKALYPELDFEAAKVAFVVDGDGGGDDLAKALGRNVPSDRIISLGLPGIENTLDGGMYVGEFVTLLRDLNPNVSIGTPPDLPEPEAESWASVLASWATDHGWRAPTKHEMANHLIELEELVLNPVGQRALTRAHADLVNALGLA